MLKAAGSDQKRVKYNWRAPWKNRTSRYFFLPITQWCSISDVLFTGGRGVSDFSLKLL